MRRITTIAALAGLATAALAGCASAMEPDAGRPAAPARERAASTPTPTQLIAFCGARWTKDLASYTEQIYTIHADGTGLRRLTPIAQREDGAPAWSPDGTRLAFGRTDRGGARLVVMDADGTHLRALTTRRGLASRPSWSPDGRSIAFEGMPETLPSGTFAQQIYVVSVAGRRVRQLTSHATFAGGAAAPAWAPDGRSILFSAATSAAERARRDIWRVGTSGSGPRRILRDASDPAWSPDGRHIAFARRGALYVATASGSDAHRIAQARNADASVPSWSPDGARLVFESTHYAAGGIDDVRLVVVDADGTGRREFTDRSPRFWAAGPAWRPNG